jgi:type II secretory pathway component PulF
MATLMESGINTTETLRLAERTLKNTQLKAKFAVCRQQVQQGMSLANVFKMTHFLPDIAIDILTVGENTGNLVNSLREITKMNRRDLTRALQILTGAVSTGALVFAFILVTAIALTIIFSVFGISSTLSGPK